MSTSSRSWIVLSERERQESANGVARRLDHLQAHLRAHNRDVTLVSLGAQSAASRIRRLSAMKSIFRTQLPESDKIATVIVEALAAPHMVPVAWILSRRFHVVLDVCDSWKLQRRSRIRAGRRANSWISLMGALLTWLTPHRIEIAYISIRDSTSDKAVLRGRVPRIIAPVAPRDLVLLDPVRARTPYRMSVAIDGNAHHTLSGLEWLRTAWPEIHRRHPDLVLDVYGRNITENWKMRGATIRGFNADLSDLYLGETLVFVANDAGSGIPNKLVEAVAAQRPMLIGPHLLDWLVPHPWIFPYESGSSLIVKVDEIMTTGLPPAQGRKLSMTIPLLDEPI